MGRIRASRASARLAENVRLTAMIQPRETRLAGLVSKTSAVLEGLANLDSLTVGGDRPESSVTFVDPAFDLFLDLGRHVDLDAERARIDKEIADARKKLDQVAKKLENPKFLAGAKPEVVEEQRTRDHELRDIIAKLEELKREYGAA